MTPALASLVLAWALAAAPPAAEGVERFRGVARDGRGEVAYLEEHVVRRAGGRVAAAVTTYRDPEGGLLATLESDYAADPWAPEYRFHHLPTGAREGVRWRGRALELWAGEEGRVLPPPAGLALAAGQGLDQLLRARLPELARGAPLEVALALPSRRDWYAFRARLERVTEAEVALRVEPASWVLRLLAPALHVVYDRASGRLLRYRGVSNLPGPGGETRPVEITYAYDLPPAHDLAAGGGAHLPAAR